MPEFWRDFLPIPSQHHLFKRSSNWQSLVSIINTISHWFL